MNPGARSRDRARTLVVTFVHRVECRLGEVGKAGKASRSGGWVRENGDEDGRRKEGK